MMGDLVPEFVWNLRRCRSGFTWALLDMGERGVGDNLFSPFGEKAEYPATSTSFSLGLVKEESAKLELTVEFSKRSLKSFKYPFEGPLFKGTRENKHLSPAFEQLVQILVTFSIELRNSASQRTFLRRHASHARDTLDLFLGTSRLSEPSEAASFDGESGELTCIGFKRFGPVSRQC